MNDDSRPGLDTDGTARRRAPNTMTDAEYAQATSPRGQLARARGLAAPYIPGGEDPDPEETARKEHRFVVLLIGMVAIIVIGGFVVTIIGIIFSLNL
ncbi:MAG TPA: hypothetical protein VNF73_08025 [Candidatus Saccharimonadales bacterium]|nr:hypothetical protein [Candidatus Saccharimonadales bacterium]